jgi:hypothetical protein
VEPGTDDQVRPVAEDLVGDVHVAASRVPRLRAHVTSFRRKAPSGKARAPAALRHIVRACRAGFIAAAGASRPRAPPARTPNRRAVERLAGLADRCLATKARRTYETRQSLLSFVEWPREWPR